MPTGCLTHRVDPPAGIPPHLLCGYFQPHTSSKVDIYLSSELHAKVPLEHPDILPDTPTAPAPLVALTHGGPTISLAAPCLQYTYSGRPLNPGIPILESLPHARPSPQTPFSSGPRPLKPSLSSGPPPQGRSLTRTVHLRLHCAGPAAATRPHCGPYRT